MGVLVFLLLIFFPLNAQGAPFAENIPIEVIYDSGNPENSVGIVGEDLFEAGTVYENYRVITFDSEAIVVRESESADHLKWMKDGKVSPKAYARGRRLFMVKQMRAIYDAQGEYLEKFQTGYAPDLNTLIDQGFLADGFQDMKKEGYRFRILQVGEAKRLAVEFKRRPLFTAVAEPLDSATNPWYFSVDQLGQVRYAKSLTEVSWGPVWEYGSMNEETPSTVIMHEE